MSAVLKPKNSKPARERVGADVLTARGVAEPLTWAIFLTLLPALLTVPAFWWASQLQARAPAASVP